MTMAATDKTTQLTGLQNIGPTIARRLVEVGVRTFRDLKKVGPGEVYRRVRAANPGKTIPLCYYLYSLEAALAEIHWDELPQSTKDRLKREVEC